MYFYELHCHMQETSRCGRSPAWEMVADYKKRGFSGMVITDHFVNGYSYAAEPTGWQAKIDAFMKGYDEARKAGEALGLKVYFGLEYTYRKGTGEDYLVLGLTEEMVRQDLVDCDQWHLDHFIFTVHQLGGIVIRAHPYRQADYITHPAPQRPGLDVDAIEVFNGGNEREQYNMQAMEWALREGKPMVAGSDTHHISRNATDYIGLEEEAKDYAALCAAIREGKAYLIHQPKCK